MDHGEFPKIPQTQSPKKKKLPSPATVHWYVLLDCTSWSPKISGTPPLKKIAFSRHCALGSGWQTACTRADLHKFLKKKNDPKKIRKNFDLWKAKILNFLKILNYRLQSSQWRWSQMMANGERAWSAKPLYQLVDIVCHTAQHHLRNKKVLVK